MTVYIIMVKTKRARKWHPLEVTTRKRSAATTIERVKRAWPKTDCVVQVVELEEQP